MRGSLRRPSAQYVHTLTPILAQALSKATALFAPTTAGVLLQELVSIYQLNLIAVSLRQQSLNTIRFTPKFTQA